jgi:hypothetical protein
LRIGDRPAEHLVAAAQAEHRAAAPDMGGNVDVPALLAQERQVGDGRFRAGQQHQVGVAGQRPARPEQVDRHVGLGAQRVEIVEIGDPRQERHDDADRPARPAGAGGIVVEAHGVLGGQLAGRGEERQHAKAAEAGAILYDAEAAGEQRRVAAELVDDEPLEAGALPRLEQRVGPDQAGDDAAAVDVADQRHRQVGGGGEPHVGDVAVAQIDLGGAAGAFDQHEVGVGRLKREALQHLGQQRRLQPVIVGRLGAAGKRALQDHLGADLALRLQQHRVHVAAGRHSASPRLQRLGAADLAAIGSDRGIVRHVLRLERAHAQAASRVGARQPGDDQRLADVGAGALQHDRRRAVHERAPLVLPSCQGLALASTSTGPQRVAGCELVDGRAKPGHDE